jgi:mannose-1-phosphate guanylyltransferase/mannose-6-phosphate isomerase
MKSERVRILLMAGGGGTRLWPLSTDARPKQFLSLLSDKSLLRETFERVQPAGGDVFVATSDRYVDLVRNDLPEVPEARILTEPARRNSGPALLGAALALAEESDAVTAAIPSDQTAADAEGFRRALAAAASLAERASVVVMAVPPTRPDTDFGYLELSEPGSGDGLEVLHFLEKPGPAEAEQLIRDGRFWNAGIFVFRPSRLLTEARRVAEDLVKSVEGYRMLRKKGDAIGAAAAYAALPDISIDFAVMEKAANVKAVPLRAGWSDVGTWRSVREMRKASDDSGNLVLSPVPVLALGVRDSAIVVSDNGVLVLPFAEERELKGAVERLKRGEKGRPNLEDTATRRGRR